MASFDSGSSEILASPGWALPVCIPRRAGPLLSSKYAIIIVWLFKFSWEFVTTLDYELNVFRRYRPHQWPIWVRIDAPFLLGRFLSAEYSTNYSL